MTDLENDRKIDNSGKQINGQKDRGKIMQLQFIDGQETKKNVLDFLKISVQSYNVEF